MNISIITPIYNGNKYLNKYLKNVSQACKNLKDVEVIWVNDSPNIKIEYDKNLIKNFTFRIVNNDNNVGIHKSRCKGIKEAKGKYILFLDQDDEISQNALETQHDRIIKCNADMIIGNGIFEEQDKKEKIFANKFSQDFASKKNPYILARNFIISPGQCLIKKESIPKYWLTHIQQDNGADDYLLWLLMFNDGAKIVCNYDVVYTHKFTGENVSSDMHKMFKSQLELIKILKNNSEYNKKDMQLLERAIMYKHNYKKHFFKETLKNLDIFVYNVWYRLVWRGYMPSWKTK